MSSTKHFNVNWILFLPLCTLCILQLSHLEYSSFAKQTLQFPGTRFFPLSETTHPSACLLPKSYSLRPGVNATSARKHFLITPVKRLLFLLDNPYFLIFSIFFVHVFFIGVSPCQQVLEFTHLWVIPRYILNATIQLKLE